MASRIGDVATLRDWLAAGSSFSLSLSSGFFGFFAHVGFLSALEDEELLAAVDGASGSSAGALVAGMFAAGLSPARARERLRSLDRSEFWDPVGWGALLKGRRFEAIVDTLLPVPTFEDCRVPLGVSAFDLCRLGTRTIASGPLARAIRASCCFPLLFQPVPHVSGLLIDGGVLDRPGLAALPPPPERRVLHHNLPGQEPPASFPEELRGCHVVSVCMSELPKLSPWALEEGGAAMDSARAAMRAALGRPLEWEEVGGVQHAVVRVVAPSC